MFYSKYKMNLYSVTKGSMRKVNYEEKIVFVPISWDNIELVKELRGKKYVKDFEEHLKNNDLGLYALCDGMPVGYGWKKNKDVFYKFDSKTCYLGNFYVNNSYRGKGIYPSLISELINQLNYKRYYIAAYDTNKSSINGLLKVGFSFVRQDVFYRILKVTIVKKNIV